MTSLLLIATLYLPVYSPKSDSQLHVAAMDTNTMAVSQSWAFPPSYTGHRSVCFLPGADSSMAFAAWTGSEEYDPATDPFGVSTGYGYPVVGVTRTSPVAPRFDLFKTGFMEVATTNTRASAATFAEPTRVRVVRWKIDDEPIYDIAVAPQIVLDKVMDPRAVTTLTEADFLDANTHDLDWDNFYSGVVQNPGVRFSNLRVVKADYLAIIGDGDVSWYSKAESNKWLTASKQVVTRYYTTNRVAASAMSVSTNTPTGSAEFSWRIDESSVSTYPKRGATSYTAFRIVADSVDSEWEGDSGIRRMPPRDGSGVYHWAAPRSWTNITSWGISIFNSKFRSTNTVWSAAQ